jgi:hypothetical protein
MVSISMASPPLSPTCPMTASTGRSRRSSTAEPAGMAATCCLACRCRRMTFKQDYLIWCGQLNTDDAGRKLRSIRLQLRALARRLRPLRRPSRCSPHRADARDGGALQRRRSSILVRRPRSRRRPLHAGRSTARALASTSTADGVRAFNNRGGLGLARGENTIEEGRFTGMAAAEAPLQRRSHGLCLVGQGYKSGGFNGEVANNATHYQDEGLFGAETVDAWEIGLKGALGDALSFEAAVHSGRTTTPRRRASLWRSRCPAAAHHLQLAGQSGCRNRAGRGTVGAVAPADALEIGAASWRWIRRSSRALTQARRNQRCDVRWQAAALRIRPVGDASCAPGVDAEPGTCASSLEMRRRNTRASISSTPKAAPTGGRAGDADRCSGAAVACPMEPSCRCGGGT